MAGNFNYIDPVKAFKKVSRYIIDDKEIDPFTLGLYVKIVSLAKNWKMSVGGLAALLKVTEEKIRKSFTILELKGYLRRTRFQDDDGQFRGWVYEFSSTPFSNFDNAASSSNPDVGEKPMSVFSEGRKKPTSGKGVGINKESNPEIEDIKEEIKLKENHSPSFPYPNPFLLSSDELKSAGKVPEMIAQIKRYHLQKNIEVIAGELGMNSSHIDSFLDYWCSIDLSRPEKIRAEIDNCFNVKQKAKNWLRLEKEGVKTSAKQQSKYQQYAASNKNFNELIENLYGTDQNNRGAGNCADNTPDEQ